MQCSAENKEYLERLHPNIRVVTHPSVSPILYSHHQKFVVVDWHTAFVGGIDLAWGRYDTHEHIIVDPDGEHWWGVDYCMSINPWRGSAVFHKEDALLTLPR